MSASKKTRQIVWVAAFAAAITITTAYVLHIPLPGGGYIHLGDTLIYLCASLLPTPWAVAAGAIGGGLADLLTYPLYVIPTIIVKAVICLPFTNKRDRVICPRNVAAIFISGLLSPTLYGAADMVISGTAAAFIPQFLGTLIQSAGSGIIFVVLAFAVDRLNLKKRLQIG